MRLVSEDEIQELGRRFHIDIDDEEVESVREQVNSNLESIKAVYDVPIGIEPTYGERSWTKPVDDPNNGIVVKCDVPPVEDHDQSLEGYTVGVKDIIAVAGVPMQCGSASMRGYIPGVDAVVVERLREAGATIAAKTNLDEFAGGSRAVSFDGRMAHPDNPDHIPGGSSGGSAITVAMDQVDVALGTDTGGSVRIPSAHCGLVGLKPTYGLVPLTGVVENTYTLDHVGPITATVEDCAMVLEAIAGKNDRDSASLQAAGRDGYQVGGYVDAVADPSEPSSLTVGVIQEGLGSGTAEEDISEPVLERTERAIDLFTDAGVSIRSISIEEYEAAGPIKYSLSYAELATHWRDGGTKYRRHGAVNPGYQAAFAARRAQLSGEVNQYYRSRILTGAQLIDGHQGRHYVRAKHAREKLCESFNEALAGIDVLLTPTLPTLPPKRDEGKKPGYDYSRNTAPANVTRHPAITIPNGRAGEFPVGLQLIGGAFEEASLLEAAATVAPLLE